MSEPVLVGVALAEALRGLADQAEDRAAAARSRASLRAAASSPPAAGAVFGDCEAAGAVPRRSERAPRLASERSRYRRPVGLMLEYEVWRDLALAFVRIEALRLGYVVLEVVDAGTGSRYVRLQSIDGVKCCVRLSDHRKRAPGQDRLFCVKQSRTGRLRGLSQFLQSLTGQG